MAGLKDLAPLGLEAARLLRLADELDTPAILHLTAGEQRAEDLAAVIAAFEPKTGVAVFPPWDCLPYDGASPSPLAMGRRMAVLRRLVGGGTPPRIVVSTPGAVLQRVPPASAVRAFEIRTGAALDAEELSRFCREAGYLADERVDEPGEVAFRGEVIEVFSGAHRWPCRVEMSDGRVTGIRRYDPATQRSIGETARVLIDPVSELPARSDPHEDEEAWRGAEHWLPEAYPELATLIDFVPRVRIVAHRVADAAITSTLTQIGEAYQDRMRFQREGPRRRPVLPPDRLYIGEDEWREMALRAQATTLAEGAFVPAPAIAATARPRSAIRRFLREEIESGRRVLLAAGTGRDMDKLVGCVRQATGRAPTPAESWTAALRAEPGALLSLKAPLDRGYADPVDDIAVLSAADLLGTRAEGRTASEPTAAPWQIEAAEFHLDDLVVHSDRGVGTLVGLEAMGRGTIDGEAIRLRYAKDQVLLVPAREAGKLWRYGSAEGEVALDRIDTAGWEKRRAKVAEALRDTADALVAAAAARGRREAAKLVPSRSAYERFAARFPFAETPDQRRAIQAVLDDLASGRPMNRLIVGDVGFGKTEVALRAAAATALSGRQVAVIAPTTVLARQHFDTFRRRFADLGVEVGHLSRLVDAKAAREVRTGLAQGRIRIVIGTHALLGDGIAFAELGLVVVDEEQRFGAKHKQRLRALSEGVHALTMSATPLPRTLQSALVGLQDLSTIVTPPARRRPIRTVTAEYDPATIRQALMRERRRGGQSFVVVPRIEDIAPMAERLRACIPRLDLRVAHGRMRAREIDDTMIGFADGDGDVLLSTSIIESGLDVPGANTMIVMRPALFGLAQLHQLRGRVGRRHLQAFCYLVTEAGEELSEATLTRLGTLQAFDRLGAGMAISAQDLDLRGGGDLFGERQAGHVKLIGVALYQELLAQAIRTARGEEPADRPLEFATDAAGALPIEYIPEAEVRINLYHRLARALDQVDVERLRDEIFDRFGPPPAPVQGLLAAASIRALARSLGVTRIAAGPDGVALGFDPCVDVERDFPETLERLGEAVDWNGERLLWRTPSEAPEERLRVVLDLLEELA